MDHAESPLLAETMLRLGRLDGRLQNSAAADIYLARSRLDGAAQLAGLAGVPIRIEDLQKWIAGRSPPPRASEGLNDPISVAAVFHIALSRDEDTRDPIARASLGRLRSVLDDRTEAETYGRSDLAYFGPLWKQLREAADAPFPRSDLPSIAARVFELASLTRDHADGEARIVSVDGREMALPPRARDRNWLIATIMPRLLHRSGMTLRVIPSLILLPKFLPPSPDALVPVLMGTLRKAVDAGLRDLDKIERAARRIDERQATKRSKAPLLARLQLAYPGLTPRAVTQLLDVTPQGARKLLTEQDR
ncbi:MAG: hypothetical protein ABJA20_01390 [Novosphingobium sp.]